MFKSQQQDPCVFYYKPADHLITGDLNIVLNSTLQIHVKFYDQDILTRWVKLFVSIISKLKLFQSPVY